jgi:hypothetical protein
MSRAEVSSSEGSSRLAAAPAVDGDLAFLRRFAGPLVLLARAMLVYIFLMDGWYQVTHYAGVGDYMSQNGVAPALLPLVILTHLGLASRLAGRRSRSWASACSRRSSSTWAPTRRTTSARTSPSPAGSSRSRPSVPAPGRSMPGAGALG